MFDTLHAIENIEIIVTFFQKKKFFSVFQEVFGSVDLLLSMVMSLD